MKVLLAVSGGIDSMTMADIIVRGDFAQRAAGTHAGGPLSFDPQPGIAHCNFHLRGAESDADEALVRDWAARKGLPFYKADFDTARYAAENGISIEMAARELRYRWFASVCRAHGYEAVAVAHNADDNAETLILNLLRGTGLKGICGMKVSGVIPTDPDISLLRPLLQMTRREIEEYAAEHGLKWREDSTNSDTAIKRNLIRHSVFPLFEKINPSFRKTLAADMAHFRQVYESRTPGLSEELLEAGFSGAMVESISRHLEQNPHSSGRHFKCGAAEAVTHDGQVIILEDSSAGAPACISVPGPGTYSFAGRDISLEIVDRTEGFEVKQPQGTLVLDAGLIGWPLGLRRWKEGDRMRPLGMKRGSRKLSDIFTDLHLSIPQKESIPILCTPDGRIAAITGYRIDDTLRIGDATSKVLVIKDVTRQDPTPGR